MKRVGLLALCVVGAGVLLTQSAPRVAPADLRVVESVSISTLDPAAISVLQDIRVIIQLYEGLTVFDPVTDRTILGCAESYSVDETGTLYRFVIRLDARWSDGSAVTAGDFVYAWRRAMEPGTAQDYAFFFEEIVGVREYLEWRRRQGTEVSSAGLAAGQEPVGLNPHAGPIPHGQIEQEADRRFDSIVAIRAEGDRVFTIELRRPVAYWLDLLALPVFLPLHRASVERYRVESASGLVYYDSGWTKPGATAYNGAYVLESWRFKRGLRLRKNPHYWDAAGAKLETIEVLDVADTNTAWLMYEAGRADWLASLDVPFASELVARAGSPLAGALNPGPGERNDIHAFGCFGTYFYNFNCQARWVDGTANPFVDPRVRRAFAMALDRKALCEHVLRSSERPATTLIPPDSIAGYPRVEGAGFDPDAGRRLLAECGFGDERPFPETVISFNNEGNHALIAQTAAAMFRKNLGVRVRIEGKESQTYRQDKQAHRFDIARASWYGDYSDPTTFLEVLSSGNGNNDSAYSDPSYDAMLAKAAAERDRSIRLQLLADAERYLVAESMPVLPLFHYVNIYAFRPERLEGISLHPRLIVPYKRVNLRT